MKKTSLVLAIILVMVFSVAAGASQTITMGTAKYLEDVMDQFKTLVEKYTNGEVQVKNLKAPVFEDEVGNITLLQNGDMTATVVGINKLGVSPSMGFVSFPYMFPSLESADRVFLSPFINRLRTPVISIVG